MSFIFYFFKNRMVLSLELLNEKGPMEMYCLAALWTRNSKRFFYIIS